jgi:hypothetical protein
MDHKTKTQQPQHLDAATAEKVLLADVSNILRKAKSGKPLTKYERSVVEQHCPAEPPTVTGAGWPQWAESTARASRVTGISRVTLIAWRKENCPAFKPNGRIDLHELRQWMVATDKKPTPRATRAESARQRLLTAQANKIEFENRVRAEEFVKKTDLVRELGPTLDAHRAAIYEALGNRAPMGMAGIDIPTARILGLRMADELCAKMVESLKKWRV